MSAPLPACPSERSSWEFVSRITAARTQRSRERPARLTKVSVVVRNLDTEPVHGFSLNVEYYDEAKGESVWKDERPHAWPDVTLEPGEAHEAVFFVPLYKTTGEDGEETKPTLQVTSPESAIVPAAVPFESSAPA